MGTKTAGMTVAQTVVLVNEAIGTLEVGPERVTAVDPAQVTVDWDVRPPASRVGKMHAVRGPVRGELYGVLHQMPEVLLVADDGAVIGIFGGCTGTKVGA